MPSVSATSLNSSWAVSPRSLRARSGSLTARKLDDDLIGALPDNNRFGNTELIDSVADNFQ